MRAVVVVASNRAAAGVYADESGPLIVERLRAWGFEVDAAQVVPDGESVGAAIAAAVRDGVAAVLTSGGTGISPTDRTPEETRALLDREIPGIAEALRAEGIARGVPTAMLSRGVAGVAGGTVVVNLPGSRAAVVDGLTVLKDVLRHAADQVAGGDH